MDFTQWRPWGERITGRTNTSTAVNVDSQIVPPGQIWLPTFAVLSNQSGETVSLTWALVRGSQVIKFGLTSSLSDGDGNSPFPLPMLAEGEVLRAIVTGTSNSSLVILAYNGWRVSLVPPAPAAAG